MHRYLFQVNNFRIRYLFRGVNEEFGQLKNLPALSKRLLLSNFLYTCEFQILPIVVNFAIWSVLNDIKYNIIYYAVYFLAHPFGFVLNGYSLRKFRTNYLYLAGMLAEVIVIVSLFLIKIDTLGILILVAFVMGLATSTYWSNRLYMVISATNNDTRNYYLGIEYTLINIAGILSPLIFGFLTSKEGLLRFEGFTETHGRILLALYMGTLIVISAVNIAKGRFANPELKRFLYFRFTSVWTRQRVLAFFEGITTGAMLVVPSMIVLNVLQDSGVLGVLESAGIAIALPVMYLIGRKATPADRTRIILLASVLLATAAILLAIWYSRTGAIPFLLMVKVAFPMLLMPGMAIRMRSIELANDIENRDKYAYFVDNEIIFNIGRIVGMLAFFVAYLYANQIFALRFGFLFIALMPFLYYFVALKIKQE